MLSDEFWMDEAEYMFSLVFPVADRATKAGVKTAMDMLIDLGVSFSQELVNEMALEMAQNYSLDLVGGITANSRALFNQYSVEWLESGNPIEDLYEKLLPVFGSPRAEMIGVTEITRLFAHANTRTWEMSGYVSGTKWMTAEDDLVCPICSPLDGRISNLGENLPPAHPRCRCWLIPVLKKGLIWNSSLVVSL